MDRNPPHRIAPKRTERARELRQEAPIPERILWGLLRGRRLNGLKFRRQVPMGPYVVDYYCAESQLVVELDGESHVGQFDHDKKRTEFLKSQGLKVLRITNDDLLHHVDAVADAIVRVAAGEAEPERFQ